MLKSKTILITICIITLTFSIAVSVLALGITENDIPETKIEKSTSPMYSYNSSIEKERTFDISKISIKEVSNILTYSGSVTENKDYPLDVYCDTYNNEYLFDNSKDILGYIKSSNINNTIGVYSDFYEGKEFNGDKSLEAANIAANFAGKLYGESFKEYELINSQKINGNYYDVSFHIPLDNDGLFSRRSCSVRIDHKGNVIYCVKSAYSIPDSFDVSMLDDVTKEKITTHAINEACSILGEAKNLSVFNISIKETDSGAAILTEVLFEIDKPIPQELFDKYEINALNSINTYCINIYYPLS